VTKRKPLSDRHAAFVRAYRETLNATESARRAGYTGTDASLRVTGSRLLAHANVAEALAKREERAEQHALLRREARLAWLAAVVAGEVPDIEVGKDLAGNVISAEPSPAKLKDRLAAMNLLGKSTGDHLQRIEAGGPGGEPVAVAVKFTIEAAIAGARGEEPTE
jgi:phage terminase small subunit